jgi:hypothetical protein
MVLHSARLAASRRGTSLAALAKRRAHLVQGSALAGRSSATTKRKILSAATTRGCRVNIQNPPICSVVGEINRSKPQMRSLSHHLVVFNVHGDGDVPRPIDAPAFRVAYATASRERGSASVGLAHDAAVVARGAALWPPAGSGLRGGRPDTPVAESAPRPVIQRRDSEPLSRLRKSSLECPAG